MTATIRSWWKQLIHGKWKVVRTGWPYKDGYGTYRPRNRTLLDSGLSREQAVQEAEILNRY